MRAPPVTPVGDGASAVVKPHASPSVRKFARELGVDLVQVRGSGPKLRVTHDDVRDYVKGVVSQAAAGGSAAAAPATEGGAGLGLLPWPKVDFAKFGPIEARPLARIKKLSAANLHRNWVMIPHVTNNDEADITELEAFRLQLNKENEKAGVKLTMLAFLIKACVNALKKYPEFNASLEGDALVYKRYWHVGFAADTPNGLVVPVGSRGRPQGAGRDRAGDSELAKKARDGKLSPTDMQGGTFSISSLGGIGGTSFSPIINAPEVAILGVSRSAMRPVWDGTQFAPRLMLPLSLSYDHRVIDGAAAARFNAHLAALLADYPADDALTTIVVVRKNGRIAIGADALVTFGETRLPGAYEANDKIIQVGDSYVGLAGTTAHFEVFRRVLAGMDTPRLHSRHEVFETFLRRAPGAQGAVLPESQGRRGRPVRELADHRIDRQPQRHLRRVFVPRGVQFRALLGDRLRAQLRAGRDVRDLPQCAQCAGDSRHRHRCGQRVQQELRGPEPHLRLRDRPVGRTTRPWQRPKSTCPTSATSRTSR